MKIRFPFFARKKKASYAQGLVIKNPIDHNTKKSMDCFYGEEKYVAQYLSDDRLEFYKDVISQAHELEVDFCGKDVVDIGCGTGHLLLEASKIYNFRKIVGLEYSTEALSRAKHLLSKGEFYQYDLYEPFTEQFDLVFCTEVLEHLLEPRKAMKNIVSMIKPGGVALITVPEGRADTFLGHINFWSPESWKVFIKDSTFGKFDCTFQVIGNDTTNLAVIRAL